MSSQSLPPEPQNASNFEVEELDDIDMHAALKAAEDIMASAQAKRAKSRKAIEVEHKGNFKEVEAKIDTLFKARKAKVIKARKAKLDQLDALLKRRKHIESQIIASMKLLEQHVSNLSKELSVVYQGREKDILEMGNYEEPVEK